MQTFDWLNPLISGAVGIVGVFVGGWLTGSHQRNERRSRFLQLQLSEFYAPLQGIRLKIIAKTGIRQKVHNTAGVEWPHLIEAAEQRSSEAVERVCQERGPEWDRVIDYDNRQWTDEIFPLYRDMLNMFSIRMHLAEPSTRAHYPALVEFVEIWERWQAGSLPREVPQRLDHSEENLAVLYEDLKVEFERLQNSLKAG